MKMKFKLITLLVLLNTMNTTKSTIVIWDIGGTLLTTSFRSSFPQMGMLNTSAYVLDFLFKNKLNYKKIEPHMKDLFLDTLALIPCKLNNPDNGALTITGKPIPALLRENLLGTLPGKQALEIIDVWIKANKSHFKSKKQKIVFEKASLICFDPETHMKTLKYLKHIELFKECYLAIDANGKKKNTCIILSNWSADKLDLLKKNFKEIFQYSDAQVFSCQEKLLKPADKLFKKCLVHKKNKHEKVIFIDDQEENRKAAENYGIIAVHPNDAQKTLKLHSII